MKIGLVCPYDITAAGGVQQQVSELQSWLQREGVEVEIVAPGVSDELGKVRTFRGNDSKVPITLSSGVSRAVRDCLKDVDVVHVHEPLVPRVGWASLSTGKPTVATFHAAPPRWVRGFYRVFAPKLRRMFEDAALTAVSDVAAAALPFKNVAIVPNGIDVSSYRTGAEKVFGRVAFLGRDDPRKGLDIALEAFRIVKEGEDRAELIVMGADRRESLPGVRFLGRVSEEDKRKWLDSSQVFLAPNTGGESFGIVVVEAMAAGCAVVVSDIPAFRGVAGGAGSFVPVGEARGFASAILDLLNNRESLAETSAKSVEVSEKFDWRGVAASYLKLYRRVFEKSS